MLFGRRERLHGGTETRKPFSDLEFVQVLVSPPLKMQTQSQIPSTKNRGRPKNRYTLNRLPVLGSRDHEGCMSPPMSFAKERPEPLPLKRVLTNHDSGLTDLSFDVVSPHPEKTVYVCGPSRDVSLFHRGNVLTCTPSTFNERVIAALSSHFYIRSNHGGREQTEDKRRKIPNAVSKCDAFVVLLSESILEDVFALSELILANLLHKVIISVKEPGFSLDSDAEKKLSGARRASILKAQHLITQIDFRADETVDDVFVDHLSSNTFVSSAENCGLDNTSDKPSDLSFSLEKFMEELSRNALVYTTTSHEECFGKLLHKLYNTVEDKFHLPPVIESTPYTPSLVEENLVDQQEQSEIALMVPPPQDRLSRVSSGYASSASPIPGTSEEKDELVNQTERSLIMKSDNFNRMDSEESSGMTLPTIESNESQDASLTPPPTGTSLRPPSEPKSPSLPIIERPMMKQRSRSYETVSSWLSRTDFESPSFMETNYVVFPSQPGGPKVKPYLFRFPKDLDDQDRRRDSYSTDITLFQTRDDKGINSEALDSLLSTPVGTPLPPADGVPTVSEMKLMNDPPRLPSGVRPRERHELPVKQQSLPIIRTSMDFEAPGEKGSHMAPNRSSSVECNPRVKSPRAAFRDRKYLKLSTVRLEYSQSR